MWVRAGDGGILVAQGAGEGSKHNTGFGKAQQHPAKTFSLCGEPMRISKATQASL